MASLQDVVLTVNGQALLPEHYSFSETTDGRSTVSGTWTGSNTGGFYRGDSFTVRDTDTLSCWNGLVVTGLPSPVKEEERMRGLFLVGVVDPDTGEVLFTTYIVANDEASARLKAVVEAQQEGDLGQDVDLDDYDVVVLRMGSVRPKRRVSEVRIVEQ